MAEDVKVRKQIETDDYCLFNGDCVQTIKVIPDESVGLTVYSPPFFDLYSYSDDPRDLSNCKNYAQFLEHYGFLIAEHFRTTMPGRVVAVHCMDLPTYKRGGEEIGLKDFPGDIIRLFQTAGFIYHSRVCIWKDPLVAATRTKAIGLAHKQICKDSAMCRTGIADTLLAFRKPGENPKPIKNEHGLTKYAGKKPLPNIPTNEDQRKNKRSHLIWQRLASPVWDDIRQTRVLPFREGRDKDDVRHICPLQLDVIERCVQLWSAPGDVVLTPFMGVGSEVYVAVMNDRKGIGIELKPSYFRQAVKNVRMAVRQREQKTINFGGEDAD